jgi:arginine decarboxylase
LSIWVPKKVFFTRGVGVHKEELRSYELALRDAGVEVCNLVLVSSILPPRCQIISKKEGLKHIKAGEITFVVQARICSNEPHRLIAASIGCGIPVDKNLYGYLSEHHGYGEAEKTAGDYAEDLAAAMLASTLGIEFNENQSWDERRQVFKISNKIVRTRNITQTAIVKGRNYHTVVALAVFIM